MEKIYIGSNGKLAAINPSNGEIIWQTKLTGAYNCDVSIVEKETYLFCGLLWKNFWCEQAKWRNTLDK